MKSKVLITVFLILFSQAAGASSFQTFLKSCGYGALVGAGVGLASLAFENRPSDHYGNIARAASLGLYVGIGMGLYQTIEPTPQKMYQDPYFGSRTILIPRFAQAQLDGAEVNTTVYSF